MSATCKFEAPNKAPSKLYDDVYKLYGEDAAKRVWAFVKTDDFTNFFGDWQGKTGVFSNRVDQNGEPEVVNGTFIDTRSNTSMPIASITENLAQLAQERINVINRLASIANRFKKSGKAESVAKIGALKEQLSQGDADKVALYRFIAFASTQADAAYNELLNLEQKIRDTTRTQEERRYDLKNLSRLSEYIQSFELVGRLGTALEGLGYDTEKFGNGVVDQGFKDKWIAPILQRVADSKTKYNQLAKPLVVDFLYTYNNDKRLTKQQLSQMLTTIHEDVSVATRWGNGLAESGDQVLALVNRAIADARNSVYQESFQFRQKELIPRLEQLEQEAKLQGIDADDYERLYSFMLEKDKNGKFTGQIVKPQNPTAAQKDFFDFYVKEYRSSQKYLPEHHRRKMQVIPILKSATERAFQDVDGVGSAASAVKRTLANKFTKQASDTDKGMVEKTVDENDNPFQFVPIHFTQKIDAELGINIQDVSLNLASSLGAFRHMAHGYHQMTNIVTELEATKDLVGERKLTQSEGGKPVMNRVTGEELTTPGVTTQAYAQLQDYLTMHVYGERQKDEGTFNFFGVEIDKAKLYNNVAGGTAFVQLGLNVYSAINNLTVGSYTNYMEGAGGQFYNVSDMVKARGEYLLVVPDLLKDYTGRSPTSKLGVLMEELDIFQEESPTGELLKEKGMIKRAGLGAVHFLTKSGEHAIQSELFIAMSKSHRVVDGKIMSYSDWVVSTNKRFDDASKAEFDKFKDVWSSVDSKEGVIATNLDRAELTRFSERIKGVYQRLHGNYAARDTPALNRHGIGRLVGLFRKFLKPGWDRRWAKDTFDGEWVGEGKDKVFKPFDRFDQRLGANIGGNYTITYNFLKKAVGDFNTMGHSMMMEDWSNMPEWKKQAVQRTAAEAAAVAALALMVKMLGSLIEDDDDPNWLAVMGLYQMKRLNQEITAFVNPITAMQLLRSPAASMSLFEKTGRILAELVPGAIGALNPESGIGRFETGKDADNLKLPVYIGRAMPIYSQVVRVMDPEAELNWMNK